MDNTIPHQERGTQLPLFHPSPSPSRAPAPSPTPARASARAPAYASSAKYLFYAKNASSSAFVGHFTFFLNSFERRGKNTSQEYFPHFSLELSHRQHQVDGIVREISLSSNLELLWVRPQTQKQGILRTAPTKNERSRSRNHSTNSTRKSCSWIMIMLQRISHCKQTPPLLWINKRPL